MPEVEFENTIPYVYACSRCADRMADRVGSPSTGKSCIWDTSKPLKTGRCTMCATSKRVLYSVNKIPDIRKSCDIDYYLKVVSEAEKRSNGLWCNVYRRMKIILEDAKEKGMPLLDVADRIADEAGDEWKGEPISLSAYRKVAKAILIKQEVNLL